MTEIKNLVDKNKCPYCGEEFEDQEEQFIHRSTCEEADFQNSDNIPKNPEADSSSTNKVEEYRRNNQYQKWATSSDGDQHA